MSRPVILSSSAALASFTLLRLARGFLIANQLVQAHGNCLSEIERNIFFTGGDIQQPVAVAEVFVREAGFFGAEKKRDGARSQPLADRSSAGFETP